MINSSGLVKSMLIIPIVELNPSNNLINNFHPNELILLVIYMLKAWLYKVTLLTNNKQYLIMNAMNDIIIKQLWI